MKDDEKARFNAALDLVQWLDLRIAQQVEHQVEQRLAREREYLRCTMSDLIVEERERISALLTKGITELVQTSHDKICDRVEKIIERSQRVVEQSGKTIAEVGASVDRMFDRIEAKLDDPMRRSDDDGQPPPSKH
jgi:AcrR family transcriptional regulator